MPGIEWTTVLSAATGTFFGLFAKEFVAGLVRRNQKTEADRDGDALEIYSAIEGVRDLADEYWTQSAAELGQSDMIAHGRITAALHQINLLCLDLFSGDAKRNCDVANLRFMQAVGGGQFGDKDREADPYRLSQIHGTALTLKDVVRRERRKLPRNFLS